MAKLEVKSNILVAIAAFYKDDPIRVFFEYIDNSLDSAEKYFDEATNSYKKDIIISFDINEKTKEIIITDNCDWINDLNVLLTSIGLHQVHWKTDHWQFWFWVFSFPAIVNKLKINTKNVAKSTWETVSITVNDIKNWNTEEDPKKVPIFDNWTEIILSDFIDKKFLKSLSVDTIKNRIETHLEWILSRKRLRIEIGKHWNDPLVCEPFDYEQYQWEVYEKIIDTPVNKPIKVYLKVIQNKQINRSPFFMVKWREIESISEISSFKSKNKGTIWRHPNLIWYIDLWNSANPNLSRNGLQLDKSTKWVFNKILELEPEIDELIQKVNKITQNEHYRKLENRLTDTLAKLAKLDNMKYRMMNSVQSESWKDSVWWQEIDANWIEWKVDWIEWEMWFWAQNYSNWNRNDWDDRRSFGTWEWDGIWPNWNPWKDFSSDEENDNWEHKGWLFWWDDFWWWFWKNKRWFWYSIKFEDLDVPDDGKWNLIRSSLIDWEIIIYKKHPDFIERTKTFRDWSDKITERLITYIAWEITVHYKDSFHNEHGQPQYNKWMFIDLVEFIYKFEEMLQDLVWQNMSDIS